MSGALAAESELALFHASPVWVGVIQNRPMLCYTGQMNILRRNQLRAEANLPLLDVPAEIARLKKAEDHAEFERYVQLRRDEFRHFWSDRSRGFLANMGIYNAVRKKLRKEMQWARGSGQQED